MQVALGKKLKVFRQQHFREPVWAGLGVLYSNPASDIELSGLSIKIEEVSTSKDTIERCGGVFLKNKTKTRHKLVVCSSWLLPYFSQNNVI